MKRYERFAERFFSNIAVRGSEEWMVSCPFHGGQDSLQFNVVNGKWFCFGCKRGGVISSLTDETLPDYTPSMAALRRTLRSLQEGVTEKMALPVSWLDQFDRDCLYWSARGLHSKTVDAWGLRYDPDKNEALVPLWAPDGGSIHGVIRRSLDPDAMIRYRYPKGFDRKSYLFGEHKFKTRGTVFVTEGSIDAIATWETGVNAVAVLGSSLTEPQKQRLLRLHPDKIVLAFDNDKAGREGAQKAKEALAGHFVTTLQIPKGYKDMADLPMSERIALVVEHLAII